MSKSKWKVIGIGDYNDTWQLYFDDVYCGLIKITDGTKNEIKADRGWYFKIGNRDAVLIGSSTKALVKIAYKLLFEWLVRNPTK